MCGGRLRARPLFVTQRDPTVTQPCPGVESTVRVKVVRITAAAAAAGGERKRGNETKTAVIASKLLECSRQRPRRSALQCVYMNIVLNIIRTVYIADLLWSDAK